MKKSKYTTNDDLRKFNEMNPLVKGDEGSQIEDSENSQVEDLESSTRKENMQKILPGQSNIENYFSQSQNNESSVALSPRRNVSVSESPRYPRRDISRVDYRLLAGLDSQSSSLPDVSHHKILLLFYSSLSISDT